MSSNQVRYDAEFWAVLNTFGNNAEEPCETVTQLRAASNDTFRIMNRAKPRRAHVVQSTIHFPTFDGTSISLTRFASEQLIKASAPQPAVVYVHGGGMVSGSVDLYAPTIASFSEAAGMPFFAVAYRLAPEHLGPVQAMDVFSSIEHLSAHAADFNIDPARICVMGDSGGGCVAASAAILARDRCLQPPLAKQVLLYPMLDDRTRFETGSTPRRDLIIWTENDNRIAWEAVLGSQAAAEENGRGIPAYTVPGRAEDLRGLPSTYIDVGGLDLLCSECTMYVQKLVAAGVDVEYHIWPGLPHAFEEAAPLISSSIRATETRIRGLIEIKA